MIEHLWPTPVLTDKSPWSDLETSQLRDFAVERFKAPSVKSFACLSTPVHERHLRLHQPIPRGEDVSHGKSFLHLATASKLEPVVGPAYCG